MNATQKSLLELADTVDLGTQSTYRLAKLLHIDHPYKIRYAIDQLIKNNYLVRESDGSIRKAQQRQAITGLINIPFYGEVNCGEALAIADDTVRGFLQVSPSVLKGKTIKNLFALKACGNSMNTADIKGKTVDDGDYVIAEKREAEDIIDGNYVISIIGGAANLKRFHKDRQNHRIVLFSESKVDLPPIIISEEDADEIFAYHPIAKVIDVIKKIPSFT